MPTESQGPFDQVEQSKLALEQEFVEAMYEAGFSTNPVVDAFSTWLLVGTATAAAFMLGNVPSLEPVIGLDGVVVGGFVLTLSCLCGVIAKYYSVRLAISGQVRAHLRNSGLEQRLRATDVDRDRLIATFVKPLWPWQRWWVKRSSQAVASGKAGQFDQQIRQLNLLNLWAGCQVALAVAFLLGEFAMIGLRAAN